MKTFVTKLVKLDGSVEREQTLTIDQAVAGYRKLLEKEDCEQFYLFRRYPLTASGEGLNVHIHIKLEES